MEGCQQTVVTCCDHTARSERRMLAAAGHCRAVTQERLYFELFLNLCLERWRLERSVCFQIKSRQQKNKMDLPYQWPVVSKSDAGLGGACFCVGLLRLLDTSARRDNGSGSVCFADSHSCRRSVGIPFLEVRQQL